VRPVEVSLFIQGATGSQFRVPSLEAANARYEFGDRVFAAPHFFVLENAFQPVRATIEAVNEPVTTSLFLGAGVEGLVASVTIPPGVSDTIGTGDPEPRVEGPQARFEVTSAGGPANIAFTATLGDQTAANVTACVLIPDVATSCLTPALFFIQNVQETVSGVFRKLSGESPDARLRVDLFIDDELVDSDSGSGDVVVSEDL
jgi:hypothetical protein